MKGLGAVWCLAIIASGVMTNPSSVVGDNGRLKHQTARGSNRVSSEENSNSEPEPYATVKPTSNINDDDSQEVQTANKNKGVPDLKRRVVSDDDGECSALPIKRRSAELEEIVDVMDKVVGVLDQVVEALTAVAEREIAVQELELEEYCERRNSIDTESSTESDTESSTEPSTE